MSTLTPIPEATRAPICLPEVAALCVSAQNAALLSEDGEILILTHEEASQHIENKSVLVCHAPYTIERLGFERFYTFDVLELFAFAMPASFCVPTPMGIARALNVSISSDFEDHPFALFEIAQKLLEQIQRDIYAEKAPPLEIAKLMGLKGKGWSWSPFIVAALGEDYNPDEEIISKRALNVWKHLPEWADDPPEPPPSHHGVSREEAQEELSRILTSHSDHKIELREAQKEYTAKIAQIFDPMESDESPHIALAEAGTGVGKTLGYLAPAHLWAEKNEGSVWVSTYTKNLQRQIDTELERIYPHPVVKDSYVSVRKGRENYLCLLNFEDLSAGAALAHNPRHAVAAGLMARWIAASKDGDLTGADFPGWLSALLGFANSTGLADRRGECVYSACDHYNRCFIERSVRKSARARIVIANHALVMIQSAMAASSETMPTRYIFDEGHHLFDAADSAFSSHLTAKETADLRRWILGNEGGKSGRARGLKKRIEDLLEGDQEAQDALHAVLHHAQALCAQNWSRRFKDRLPSGPTEEFLLEVYRVVFARSAAAETPYSLETELYPLDEDLGAAAQKLRLALEALLKPIKDLEDLIHKKLINDDGMLDKDVRKRLDAMRSSLERRGKMTLQSWINMLSSLEEEDSPVGFIDWMEIERIDGKAIDVGLYRHYIDPMKPFASSIRPHVHGMAITSATLQDRTEDETQNWQAAKERSGANYLSFDPMLSSFSSPFNYKDNAKVIILNDVNKNDFAQVAGAYRALFKASNGSALGLFTAIQRLRAVYENIHLDLEKSGIPIYAQHSNAMDAGTLIDIFREEERACLLGTDAVRDGVDVPGDSLRLLVFDRVPWPRPTLLHKARRDAFGKRRYDEMVTRFKLKQAFGRLIRRDGDRGIFVMLDSMLPSRLHGAFPEDTEILKIGLSEACSEVEAFFR